MKKMFLIFTLLLLSFIVKGQAQDTVKVQPVLIEQRLTFTEDKTFEEGIMVYYDIFMKGKTPLRASITTSNSTKPYYIIEEILFKNDKISYYNCKKIYNGLIDSEINITFSNGYVTSMIVDGKNITEKEQIQAIIDKVSHTLYMINEVFLKDLE